MARSLFFVSREGRREAKFAEKSHTSYQYSGLEKSLRVLRVGIFSARFA